MKAKRENGCVRDLQVVKFFSGALQYGVPHYLCRAGTLNLIINQSPLRGSLHVNHYAHLYSNVGARYLGKYGVLHTVTS